MLRIDKAILDTNEVICDNISKFDASERGLLSQNILGHLRNFVEYIAIKVYSNGSDINPNNYEINVAAIKSMQSRGDLRFLYKFHEMLQKSVSHYTVDKDGAERLMLKYYEHLLRIKKYLKETYNMDVLRNLHNFPINTDTELLEYYGKISERLDAPYNSHPAPYNERYYIQKIKPFFVNQRIYYEVTFTTANAKASKFDRVIAFTKHEITDNYAVKLNTHYDEINILGKNINILVIDSWSVSIRPCELENLSIIFGKSMIMRSTNNEYKQLMKYLTVTKMTLTELISSDEDYYEKIKETIRASAETIKICHFLDKCRNIIINNKPGSNVLRYLLYKINNRVIKLQRSKVQCPYLSNLYLSYKCIPFDQMPFCSSLKQHNPRIYDLFESIPFKDREHELFAKFIKNNTEIEGQLFTPIKNIVSFEDINSLIDKYNNALYQKKHSDRKLEVFKDHIYIKGYADDCTSIIQNLQELASSGVSQYTNSVDSWLIRESYNIDDPNKKEALRQMFSNSHVALIYGAAGTGKSTLMKHISNFWADQKKIYLANTHPAVDNMQRMVLPGNSSFSTIASFLSPSNTDIECDILFIDECSTVSNADMRQVLEKANFKLIVLIGDIYQIESISFGNWFSIAQKFVTKSCVFELTNTYRTSNNDLLELWHRVRNIDDSILELLVKNNLTTKLNESIFERTEDDEIILCLNYDGLYGINNINCFLQNCNPSLGVLWGVNIYKVNDPILFNESNKFSPLIHNNAKGKIVGIRLEDNQIWFNIELDKSINEIDASKYKFELVGESDTGHSIISFSINKYQSTDNDEDDDESTVVPFQVAYAVSIHKAQGLEYNYVKVVITNEIEERISHNIFYTAITRAKERLRIYWSPETEKAILNRLQVKNFNKDANLLAKLSSLSME